MCGTRDLIRLGGLRERMPLVATTFGLGALSLAGVPVLNGFWSKELILSHSAPAWAFLVMLVVAAITALYSARVMWRVFFSPYVPHVRVHDAPLAMRLALVPLAAGTLLSWLAASALGDLLAIGVPLEPGGANPLIEVLTGPTTLVGILAISVGIVAWWWRDALEPIVRRLAWLRVVALDDFGFPRVEHVLARTAVVVAANLQATQTGRLSWNVAAMLVGLTIALAALALGGSPG